MSDLQLLLSLVKDYGVTPLLILVVVFGYREYRRLEHRCLRWERLALSSLADTSRANEVLADFFRGEA